MLFIKICYLGIFTSYLYSGDTEGQRAKYDAAAEGETFLLFTCSTGNLFTAHPPLLRNQNNNFQEMLFQA